MPCDLGVSSVCSAPGRLLPVRGWQAILGWRAGSGLEPPGVPEGGLGRPLDSSRQPRRRAGPGCASRRERLAPSNFKRTGCIGGLLARTCRRVARLATVCPVLGEAEKVPDFATITSLIGALGLGSVLGQWINSARDRRSSRANALLALGRVETARWAPVPAGGISFQDAARALMTAALLARIPNAAVREYLTLAQAAAWLSATSWEEDPDQEIGGGAIDSEFSQIVRDAAHHLAGIIWAPAPLRRLTLSRRLRELQSRAEALTRLETSEALKRSRSYGVA
ncbi:hypothetical protein BKA19_0161 [Blastococcus saxobsidens]|uniref:Uncharacterized protein n=1 Tax=Blastococcus saxobsidens TaxID=138336 RepID=A0A4Q7Y3J1_9ACTN|nr:hypothetical protein BKA19_0161 [Blastococcus saxobsidens]